MLRIVINIWLVIQKKCWLFKSLLIWLDYFFLFFYKTWTEKRHIDKDVTSHLRCFSLKKCVRKIRFYFVGHFGGIRTNWSLIVLLRLIKTYTFVVIYWWHESRFESKLDSRFKLTARSLIVFCFWYVELSFELKVHHKMHCICCRFKSFHYIFSQRVSQSYPSIRRNKLLIFQSVLAGHRLGQFLMGSCL